MSPLRHRRQRGFVTILAVFILITGVFFWLLQSQGIIGNTSRSNEAQGNSSAAFFLAESGVELAKSILSTSGATSADVCKTTLSEASKSLGLLGGTYSLVGVAYKNGVPNSGVTADCVNDCDSCKVTSTGTVGSANRTIEVTFKVSDPTGGAAGCGGGGGTLPAATAACAGYGYSSDIYTRINQSISVTAEDVILFSNMAFIRHPKGNTTQVSGDTCVAEPGGNTCITQWDTQSKDDPNDINAVGSRGSAIALSPTVPTTYTLEQTLTNDSLFAAIGAKFGGSGLGIVGHVITSPPHSTSSYWDDLSGNANSTVSSQSSVSSGKTNNGAACATADGSSSCPWGTDLPDPPTYNTKQAGKNWCYDADTLVFGFSANHAANGLGQLTSFKLGTSPESTPIPTEPPAGIPNGHAYYPLPPATPRLYASLRYLYNPSYFSAAASASSGGEVTAKAGIPTASFTFDNITAGATTFNVKTIGLGYSIHLGDKIFCTANAGTGPDKCNVGTEIGSFTAPPASCLSGGAWTSGCSALGIYTISASTKNVLDTNQPEIRSTVLQVDPPSANQWLSVGDIFTIGSTYSIKTVPAGCSNNTCNSSGNYGLDLPLMIANGTSVIAKGYTIHVVNPDTAVPAAGTVVEARSGATLGKIASANGADWYRACVAKTVVDDDNSTGTNPNPAPARSASLFYLNNWDTATNTCGTTRFGRDVTGTLAGTALAGTTRLAANQICGGICAFFNHHATLTGFSLAYDKTNQWSAGMTCLKGVDTSKIKGLTGTATTVESVSWHEQVK